MKIDLIKTIEDISKAIKTCSIESRETEFCLNYLQGNIDDLEDSYIFEYEEEEIEDQV